MLACDPPGFYQHHHPGLQPNEPYLNRFVTDHDQMAQSNSVPPRSSPPLHPWRKASQTSPSFGPRTSSRQEPPDNITLQLRRCPDRAPVTISPFRSVRRMKEPFDLKLPSSPGSRTPGQHTLRSCRSDQNLGASSVERVNLLPSPPLSDSRLSNPSPSSAYFVPNGTRYPQDNGSPGSRSFMPLSMPTNAPPSPEPTEEEDLGPAEVTNVHMAHSSFIRQSQPNDNRASINSTDTEHMRSTQPPVASTPEKRSVSLTSMPLQRPRARTASSEASWMSGNLSYSETWLQDVPVGRLDTHAPSKEEVINRRKCQIFQKSPTVAAEEFHLRASQEPVVSINDIF